LTESLVTEAEMEQLLEKVEREWPQTPEQVDGFLLAGDRRRASQFQVVALAGFLAGFVCAIACVLMLVAGGAVMATYAEMLTWLLQHQDQVRAPADVERALDTVYRREEVDALMNANLLTVLQSLSLRDLLRLAAAGEKNRGG
jgi:hypothetical protein